MRRVQALVGILLLVGLFGGSYQGGMKSGPYNIIIERVTPCSDETLNKGGLVLHPSFKKINGVNKLLYSGGVNLPFNKEEFEALEVKGDFYQKKSNDFLYMYKYEANLCKALNEMAKDFYSDLVKQIGVEPDGCAIPPGNHSFSDWDIQIKLPMPMLEYMTYKAILTIVAEKQVFICIEAIAEVKRKF